MNSVLNPVQLKRNSIGTIRMVLKNEAIDFIACLSTDRKELLLFVKESLEDHNISDIKGIFRTTTHKINQNSEIEMIGYIGSQKILFNIYLSYLKEPVPHFKINSIRDLKNNLSIDLWALKDFKKLKILLAS